MFRTLEKALSGDTSSTKCATYVRAVVWADMSSHVDLRTTKEEEDGDSEHERSRREDDEFDSAGRRQLQS